MSSVEQLYERLKQRYEDREPNASCRVCGALRYIPQSNLNNQTTRRRGCWVCREIRDFDVIET